MSTPNVHPRRRANGSDKASAQNLMTTTTTAVAKALQKGATFHSPISPPTPGKDPVLNITSIPHRSPTCPETLEKLVVASDQRVAEILDSIERSLADTKLVNQEDLKDASTKRTDFPTEHKARVSDHRTTAHDHTHTSDSGLGTSVEGSTCNESIADHACAKETDLRSPCSVYTAVRTSHGESHASGQRRCLSDYAANKIRSIIVNPLLAERRFKDYHPIVETIPSRVRGGSISCLRDLEKALIFLAPSRSKSASLYYKFCESSIQYIQTTTHYLSERDQTRPTDRPYTNNYFIDLIDQVRQYASIMAASRRAEANGRPSDNALYSPSVSCSLRADADADKLMHYRGEKIRLQDGHGENGKPVQLVREKNGETMPIEAQHKSYDVETSGVAMDDDAVRSMARKRKCDIGKEEWRACRECGKEFKRPCDLTKHEKTHSRPWKCSVSNCKYFDLGWPTEKERDRHVNDKHSAAPALFRCLYDKCAYTSKRESNCKQHMEKAHGWEYRRSKSKKGQVLIPTVTGTQPPSTVPTPTSALPSLSTPRSTLTASPAATSNTPFSPNESVEMSEYYSTDFSKLSSFEDTAISSLGRDFGSPENALETPTSDVSFLPMDVAMQPQDTELDFNFGPIEWPPMDTVFSHYAIDAPTQVQQPTPDFSDFNMDMKDHEFMDAEPLQNSNDFARDGTVHNPAALEDLSPSTADLGPLGVQGMYSGNQDFQLFGGTGQEDSENMTSMFSDLGSVGGQFSPTNQDPMYAGMEPYDGFIDAFKTHD